MTDTNNTRKDKAVRIVEKTMRKVEKQLPEGFEIPQIAVIGFEKHGIGVHKDAIGGYDPHTGIMFINSKYDTKEKILEYVNRFDNFANKTECAPFLHELGHKNYYDSIKTLAKSEKMSYNEAQKIVDRKILDTINGVDVSDQISFYAYRGLVTNNLTEVAAECFSIQSTNDIAQNVIKVL